MVHNKSVHFPFIDPCALRLTLHFYNTRLHKIRGRGVLVERLTALPVMHLNAADPAWIFHRNILVFELHPQGDWAITLMAVSSR